jgi:hypothetical protein
MATPRTTRTDAELAAASEHLYYELEAMLEGALLLYKEWGKPDGDQSLINALLESVLIHTRNLLFFLGWERGGLPLGKPDDIVVEDFGSPRTGGTPSPHLTIYTKLHIDKWVGHLTYERIRSAKPLWAIVPLGGDIYEEILAFARSLPSSRLHSSWASVLPVSARPVAFDALRAQLDAATAVGVPTGMAGPLGVPPGS